MKDLTQKWQASVASGGRRLRILVVDDDRVTYRLVSGLLEKHGYEVQTAEAGARALELLAQRFYDLVLLDVEMPGMNGLEVARAIRSLPAPTASVPVVGLTGHEGEDDKAACLGAGMDGVLSKPIRAQALFQAIERWLKFPGRGESGQDRPRKATGQPLVNLEEAAARCGNDMEFVSALLKDFVSDGPRRVEMMTGLAARQKWVDLSQAAHQLKGAAGNLSAYNLADLARRLQEACRREDRAAVARIVAELREEFAHLAAYTSDRVGASGG